MDGTGELVPMFPQGDAAAASSWCAGYLAGVRFDRVVWATLMIAKPKWFAPILCLGTVDDDSPTPDPRQVAHWMKEVAPSAAKIQAFWLTKRRAHPPSVPAERIPVARRPPGRGKAPDGSGCWSVAPCDSAAQQLLDGTVMLNLREGPTRAAGLLVPSHAAPPLRRLTADAREGRRCRSRPQGWSGVSARSVEAGAERRSFSRSPPERRDIVEPGEQGVRIPFGVRIPIRLGYHRLIIFSPN